MHEMLVDNSVETIDSAIDRERLINAIRESLIDLTPREEIVLRLRFGISEPDLEAAIAERNTDNANA